MDWKVIEGVVGGKDVKVSWVRNEKGGDKKKELWVKMMLGGYVFKGRVEFVEKLEVE